MATVTPHTSLVNIAETEYVLCRKVGHASASRRIDALLASGYLAIEDDVSVHRAAADCYTLAVAEATSSTPLFAHREQELVKEMGRRPFPTPPFFLD
jgi:hypothetical protein